MLQTLKLLTGLDISRRERQQFFKRRQSLFHFRGEVCEQTPTIRADFASLNQRIPGAHVDYLRTSGVEAEHLRDWEKLIAMRYEEYARDRHGVRAAAMQIESADKDLDRDGLALIQLLVPVQAVAIGCHHHVCRGNTEGQKESRPQRG